MTAIIGCTAPLGMTFPVTGLAGTVAPAGNESFISLNGANSALNAPNAQASDAANNSGAGAQGVGMGITTMSSQLWAQARTSAGSGAINAAITAGVIVVIQA